MIIDTSKIESFLQDFQLKLANSLEKLETNGVKFVSDKWQKPNNEKQLLKGYGNSMTIEGGNTFEKGVIAFSSVKANNLPATASAKRPELANKPFVAMGISVVIHPKNPFAPISHANFRLFVANPESENPIWWFGGGYDLTPFYPFDDDIKHWHQTAKKVCDKYDINLYPEFKKWCDEYFFIKHRNERRGIGGLFFDDFNRYDFNTSFNFIKDCAQSFIDAYIPIISIRKDISFKQKHKDFQLYRRGRYVEFNLVYDRGTIFGLQSGGRTESILSSMPPLVSWKYNYIPEKNSEESKIYKLIKPIF